MIECLAVGAGGFLGSILRYLISSIPLTLIPFEIKYGFPLKTFLINIIGCFAIGLIVALIAKNHELSPNMILFLKVGVCGGFTTFSTFALEISDLMAEGNIWSAVLYAVLSMVLGVGAVFLGMLAVR